LYSRSRIIGVSELAEILETNPRNIPEYVRELREIGYDVRTVQGRYGGYYLERHNIFPSLKLSDKERDALMSGYEYLLARNDFMDRLEYGKAMGKITSAIMNRNTSENETLIMNRYPLAMEQKDLQDRYLAVNQCIASKLVLDISYTASDNVESRRKIHPYKLYMYNNAWFVLAYDENTNEIRYFKLNRINKFEILGKKFRVLLAYKESDYLDEYGMKQNGEWYPIKLKITGKYAMLVKERIYGKNQTVEPIDKNTSILSVEMQNKEDILHFVLGFGANCEVLEPPWLRLKVKTTVDALGKRYEKMADS
jgi:predicted DNA-binding transcriptional regulator YafY